MPAPYKTTMNSTTPTGLESLLEHATHLLNSTSTEARATHDAAAKASAMRDEASRRYTKLSQLQTIRQYANAIERATGTLIHASFDESVNVEDLGNCALGYLQQIKIDTAKAVEALYAFYCARCKEQDVVPKSNPWQPNIFDMFSTPPTHDDKLDAARFTMQTVPTQDGKRAWQRVGADALYEVWEIWSNSEKVYGFRVEYHGPARNAWRVILLRPGNFEDQQMGPMCGTRHQAMCYAEKLGVSTPTPEELTAQRLPKALTALGSPVALDSAPTPSPEPIPTPARLETPPNPSIKEVVDEITLGWFDTCKCGKYQIPSSKPWVEKTDVPATHTSRAIMGRHGRVNCTRPK